MKKGLTLWGYPNRSRSPWNLSSASYRDWSDARISAAPAEHRSGWTAFGKRRCWRRSLNCHI